MKTRLYPMVQFKKDTWEIDEFECASVFVLVGKEKAMVIDAGIGIGDLIGAIRMTITDKPMERFNTLLLHYYETGEKEELKDFLYTNAIQGIETPVKDA